MIVDSVSLKQQCETIIQNIVQPQELSINVITQEHTIYWCSDLSWIKLLFVCIEKCVKKPKTVSFIMVCFSRRLCSHSEC